MKVRIDKGKSCLQTRFTHLHVESQGWLTDLRIYYIPEVERTQCNGKQVEHYCRGCGRESCGGMWE